MIKIKALTPREDSIQAKNWLWHSKAEDEALAIMKLEPKY